MNKPERRTNVSFKDVQIAYLLDGIAGVEKLLSDHKNAGPVIKRALKQLRGQGRNVESLQSFVNDKFGGDGRGRAMPLAGEERRYKAQQVADSGVFLRLPLTTIAAGKGDVLKVRFEADRIVISKA
jgi:hypothetical protein